MAEKKKQHYIPRFYLKNFSICDQGKAIGVFNITSRKLIPSASLKEQAYENYFYGTDKKVENILETLERQSAPLIRNIIQSNTLSTKNYDRITLLIFTLFLRSRNVYASQEKQELIEKYIRSIHSKDSRLKDHMHNIKILVPNPTRMAISSVAECLPLAFDLDCELVVNQTSLPFLTSDNPVIYYNQFMETRKAIGSGIGLSCKGFQIFLPVSPRHCLIFYDRDVYKIGSNRDTTTKIFRLKDIVSLNELQYINALENLFFNQEIKQNEINKYIQSTKKYRSKSKVDINEYMGRTDEQGTHYLLHTQNSNIRCKLKLGFIKFHKQAKHYELGKQVIHVRDEHINKVFEEFHGLVKQGKYQISDFPKYLKQVNLTIKSTKP